ncbi:RHS repeat protein [Chitinophaga sp.]|uniref:RHS repeat protein n=1 Tax=Chitinophaga sp. TaxID=1869181 RepID=UPI002618D90F|nr:RHS repeat domain-containing protein [uncultured Chitinophaga sp.]
MSTVKRKATCLFVTLVCAAHTFSQDLSSLAPPLQVPPTPEAAALFRVQEVPVSLCNGLPEITVPLGEFKLKSFTHTIALRYHAGGIRVDEAPSCVGSGWSLQAGGVLAATVHGKPDLLNGAPGPEGAIPPSIVQDPHWAPPVWTPDRYADARYTWFREMADRQTDLEPDLFSFTAGGFSGKFYFDHRGYAHPVPLRKIQVSGLFRIRDEDGNTFHFDLRETAATDNGQASTQFYLSKIVTPLRDSILFHYEPLHFTYRVFLGETRYTWLSGVRRPDIAAAADIYPSRTATVACRVKGWRLKEISASNGARARMVYQAGQRTDLPGTHALAAVEWLYHNDLRKRFRFVHGYTGDTRFPESHRLWLKEVYEEAPDGKRLPSWVFGYNDARGLPPRLSSRQDHWGYANGTGAGSATRLPQHTAFTGGALRDPDTLYSRAGMLTSIRYPTGGSTLFMFEPNTIWVHNEERKQTVQGGFRCNGEPNATVQRAFTLPQGAYDVRIRYNTLPPQQPRPRYLEDVEYATEHSCGISLKKPGGKIVSFSGRNAHPDGDPENLPPGAYTITIRTDGDGSFGFWQITYKNDSVTRYSGSKIVGGWRIRSIVNTDPLHPQLPDTRTFHYGQPDAYPDRSSGICPARPQYEYQRQVCHYKKHERTDGRGLVSIQYELQCGMLMIQHAGSVNPLSGDHGPVLYPRVEVREGENGASGRTVHTFSYMPKAGGPGGYPFVAETNFNGYNGKLLKAELFRKTPGGGYQPTETTVYAWSFVPAETYWRQWFHENTPPAAFRGLGMHISYLVRERHEAFQLYSARFHTGAFRHLSEWYRCDSIVRMVYPDSGPPLRSATLFRYDNPLHLQPTQTITVGSNGERLVQVTKYPGDYSGNAVLAAMVRENQVRKPVEQWAFRDHLVSQHVRISYTSWHGGAFIMPETIFTASHGRSLQPEMQFVYDKSGNLVQTTARDGLVRSMLWGYGYRFPVAEITGIPYSVASGWLDNTVLQQPASEARLRTELQKIRVRAGQSPAVIRTFTHSPLTGVTSITGPDGRTVHYEYDGFGRLGVVRDQNGNILKLHKYAYQAPQQE